MTTYLIIQPPFSLQFRDMHKTELKAYFDWFLSQVPVRINILESFVKQTHGYEGWSADYSVDSLKMLGVWFANQVEMRPRSDDELAEIRGAGMQSTHNRELTNKTFSLAIDIAMYFSEILKRDFPGLRWDLILKSKKFVDYGQPVLVGFGNVPLNPVSLMVVFAYGLAKKTKSGERLLETYNYWASTVK